MATGWGRRKRVEMQKYATGQSPTSFATICAGLDTNTTVNDDASNVTAGSTEPSSSNGYGRQTITTWNAIATPSNDASAVASNDTVLTWTSSGGAFSTGATTLKTMTLWTSTTLSNVAESFFEGRAAIAVPQAVNAAGITLTCADGGLVMGLISAT